MDIQTLFNALKTKYPQSGLSDNEITGLAKSLFATGLVTDENAAAIVDGQADTMKGFQSLFDSRFTSKKNDLTKTLTESLEKSFKEKYHIDENGKSVGYFEATGLQRSSQSCWTRSSNPSRTKSRQRKRDAPKNSGLLKS